MILRFKKGFSLVELLVVIAIIGILAAVGITAYQGYTQGAKERAALAQHSQVVKLINAEFAKCAGGSGYYAWTTLVSEDAEGAGSVDDYLETIGILPDNPSFDEFRTVLLQDDDTALFDENRAPGGPWFAGVTGLCSDVSDETHIASHVNTTLGMTNPYDVTTGFAEAGDENGNASEIGKALIFCDDTDGDCQIRTQYKDNTYEETNIQPY